LKTVLITGASGFVGNNLARYMLNQGHRLHLILRENCISWRLEDIKPYAEIHLCDLCDQVKISTVVSQVKPDWIFHLAAYGAYSHQADLYKILQTNVLGTANLVKACLEVGFESFINAGSSSEYGFTDHAPTESASPDPNSYYAVSKASSTMLLKYTSKAHGFRIQTLRLYSVYGPYEDPSRLIPALIMNGINNRFPPLVNPDVARDFVYVDDVSRAFELAASVEKQEQWAVYNVGTGVQTTIGQVVEIARRTMGITEEPKWSSMPNRIWDTTSWVSNTDCIRQALGWAPALEFHEGFSATVKWFRNCGSAIGVYR
jgi:UDP-glucose 4-epimerase